MGNTGSANEAPELRGGPAPPPSATGFRHPSKARNPLTCLQGIDLGGYYTRTAVHTARDPGGLPRMVKNDVGVMEARSLVAFRGKDRLFADSASAISATTPKGVISNARNLCGCSDLKEHSLHPTAVVTSLSSSLAPEYTLEVAALSEKARELARGSSENKLVLSPIAACAMMLEKTKEQGDASIGHQATSVAIALPASFQRHQVRAVLDAAAIAGYSDVFAVDDGVCLALCYAFKRELPVHPIPPAPVLFADVGHTCTRLTLCALSDRECNILSRATDSQLGTRDFDLALYEHARKAFQKTTGLDISTNPRSAARLMKECERAKNVLSANHAVEVKVECLMNDQDLSLLISRGDFEALTIPLRKKFEECLSSLGIDRFAKQHNIHHMTVEAVGGGTRIPIVREVLHQLTGMELSYTMDGATSVAIGATLFAGIHRNQIAYAVNDKMSPLPAASMGLSKAEILSLSQLLNEFNQIDKEIRETRAKKNDLEAFVYAEKDRYEADLGNPGKEARAKEIIEILSGVEQWLYGEGEDASYDVYAQKLEEITKIVRG